MHRITKENKLSGHFQYIAKYSMGIYLIRSFPE